MTFYFQDCLHSAALSIACFSPDKPDKTYPAQIMDVQFAVLNSPVHAKVYATPYKSLLQNFSLRCLEAAINRNEHLWHSFKLIGDAPGAESTIHQIHH